MPVITQYERKVSANPTPQPYSSGDGYSAPGRGLASIGAAIGRLGEQADEQEMFKAKMAVSEYEFNKAKEEDERAFNFVPGRDGAASDYDRDYITQRTESDQKFLSQFSGKARQAAELHLQSSRQSSALRAQNHRQNLVVQETVGLVQAQTARAATTVDGSFDSVFPALKAIDGAVNEAPGLTPRQRALLREHAAEAVLDAWESKAPWQEKEKRLQEMRGSVGKWLKGFEGKEGDQGGPVMPGSSRVRQDTDLDGRTAAVRYNNPGAQYPSAAAEKFGMTGYGVIGGGHKIAMFPSDVHGGAANMDNFATNYRGLTLRDAVAKWRGGNGSLNVPEGFDPSARVDESFLSDRATMVKFFDGMSRHEGRGKAGPVSRDTWGKAFDMYQAGGVGKGPAVAAGGPLTGTPPDETGGDNGDAAFISARDRLKLPDSATMGDHVIKRFLPRVDRLEKQVQAGKAEEEGKRWFAGVIAGTETFNPNDAEGRKAIDGYVGVTDIGKKVFEGDIPSVYAAGQLSEKIRYVPKAVYDGLKGLTENPDIKKQAVGWTAIQNLVDRNPNIMNVHGDDKALIQQAEYVRRLSRIHGMEKALQIIAAEKDPDAKIHKKAVEKDVEKFMKGYEGANGESQIAKDMDEGWWPFSRPSLAYDHIQKARAITDYRDSLKRHYEATGSEEKAKANAISEFKQTYGVSTVMGERVMPYPPERFYPAVEGSHKYIEDDLKKTVGTFEPSAKLDTIRLVADGKTAADAAMGKPSYKIRVERADGRIAELPARFAPDPKTAQAALKEKFDTERAKGVRGPKDTSPNDPHMILRRMIEGGEVVPLDKQDDPR